MADGIKKLVAFLPGGEKLEFKGADVVMFGHNPETGFPLFAVTAQEPQGGLARVVTEGMIDVYHNVPYMIRQPAKAEGGRIHKPPSNLVVPSS